MSSIAFDHIALGMPRIADAVPFLVGVLGGIPHSGMRGGSDFRFGTWRYATVDRHGRSRSNDTIDRHGRSRSKGGKIEVIEPIGTDGFVSRFLAARGPGIHHVTFKVPNLDEACERARARGYDIVGYDDSYDDWKTAFLHPKQALGIVVQFAQTSDDGSPTGWKPPATVGHPPAPVTVVGLRMRVSAADRAREQWEGILQAARVSGNDASIVYGWPKSPMILTVDVDPSASEGPIAIELRSSRPLALPRGAVPELGTTFRLVGGGSA
jgi:catechol 2,3-dioxygenase-like lactoylglutathione lyase family enzyme